MNSLVNESKKRKIARLSKITLQVCADATAQKTKIKLNYKKSLCGWKLEYFVLKILS